MTTEHRDLDYLKSRFEDGDRPTGDDFARLLDSCHNTRQLTDVTITKNLTVDGTVNTRDVAADGIKLDNLDSFVRSNSDSWEETDHILAVSSTVVTVSSVLSDNIHTLNSTLHTYIDNNISTLDVKIDNNQTAVDQTIATLQQTIDQNTQSINNNNDQINTRVDNVNIELDELETDLSVVTTTVADNSASWGVDEDTKTLGNLLDVDTSDAVNADVLKYNAGDGKWYAAHDLHGEGQHVDTFVELHDCPVSYTGSDDKFVKVNSDGTGLVFVEHDVAGWNSTTSTVRTNSGEWQDAFDWGDHATANYLTDYTVTVHDVTGHQGSIEITENQISDLQNYLTDYTVTVHDVTGHQGSIEITENQISNLQDYLTDYMVTVHDVTGHQGSIEITKSQITDFGDYLTDYTVTVHDVTGHQGSIEITENQISDLQDYLTSSDIVSSDNWDTAYTIVSAQSANWAAHADTSTIQSNLTQLESTVTNISNDVTDVTTTVNNNSGNWAVLDNTGKLLESQIPELSITQTYTVQNTEEVATLNPAEGIQRGDIVIVYNTYDNLVAKQDNPTGVYDASTKSYSGYSKLARPDAYVTAVNDKYGNVVLTSDDIDDTDSTNKWVDQTDIDRWNSNLNTTGGTMVGDLDTTASYLSGGSDLKDIFWSKGDDLGSIGNFEIQGELTADTYSTKDISGTKVTGITDTVNVGGNILHIVNGIIVRITDEA